MLRSSRVNNDNSHSLSLTFHPISTLANGQSRLTASLIMLNFFCSSCNQVARYYSCDLARCLTTEKTIIIHSNAKTSLLFVCRDCSPDQLSFLFSLSHTHICVYAKEHTLNLCVRVRAKPVRHPTSNPIASVGSEPTACIGQCDVDAEHHVIVVERKEEKLLFVALAAFLHRTNFPIGWLAYRLTIQLTYACKMCWVEREQLFLRSSLVRCFVQLIRR